ncbi:histidine kinase-like protein [Murinocardiopsis flavida]|uniref:Histidine kinase-like protein n=1 Tax=Murinocardiopsis flavida TaxID=645275 RepID=A0A2P8DG30_9ACTN|nr:ATP-binding protein [Murinocardiopsis flavida]PSK96175.1 histidine kinase-like protein [Murinocardiopsis flavida]
MTGPTGDAHHRGRCRRWNHLSEGDVVEARRLVTATGRTLGLGDEELGWAELMASELVTNALVHALGIGVEVEVWHCPLGCVVTEVRDGVAARPILPAHRGADLDAESGRGLAMVTGFSDGLCGAAPSHVPGTRKTVWFALPLADGAGPVSVRVLSSLIQIRNTRQHGPSSHTAASNTRVPVLDLRAGRVPDDRGAVTRAQRATA